MSTQPTPGEWKAGSRDSTGTINAVFDSCGNMLCEVYQPFYRPGNLADDPHHLTQVAHARLIAAAPSLLSLLDVAQEKLDVMAEDSEEAGFPERASNARRLARRIRAVIAKAKGEA